MMVRVFLYSMCAWLSALPTARAGIIVNWLETPIVLEHEMFMGVLTPLDLDNNGVADFTFLGSVHLIGVQSEGQNQFVIIPDPPPNVGGGVEPLYPEFEIGSNIDDNLAWFGTTTDFAPFGIWLSTGGGGSFSGHHAYMGVEFYIDDNIHYGWINMWVAEGGPYGEIYGWAYNSDPGIPIIAGAVPEPSTILLFVAGTLALLYSNTKRRFR